MSELKRRSTMTPFLSMRSNEFAFCRVLADKIIDIKGDDRAVLELDIYLMGPADPGLPGVDDLLGSFSNTPVRGLVGKGRAFSDAIAEIKGGAEGKFLLLHYSGTKKISGGKTFNQWDIQELELTTDELKQYGVKVFASQEKAKK